MSPVPLCLSLVLLLLPVPVADPAEEPGAALCRGLLSPPGRHVARAAAPAPPRAPGRAGLRRTARGGGCSPQRSGPKRLTVMPACLLFQSDTYLPFVLVFVSLTDKYSHSPKPASDLLTQFDIA